MSKKVRTNPFGYSLHIDAYDCSVDLNDITFFHDFLRGLTAYLGMTEQSPPFVFKSPPQFPEKEGLSGYIPLIESGISIHTIVPTQFVTVDIYSCRKFNHLETTKWVVDKIGSDNYEIAHLLRGLRYSKSGECR